jgi:diguanylate cyclase (GGDEF)-like protein
VAHVLASGLCASEERVARFGGEEFAVLLPGLPLAEAMRRAESMRQAIERLVVESADQRVSVTASFGVAAMSQESGETGADVLRHADRALYEAKRRGRNCVVASGPDSSGAYGFQQLAVTD